MQLTSVIVIATLWALAHASDRLLKPARQHFLKAVHHVPSEAKLFCFAWTTYTQQDEGLIEEVRKQFSKCDGHKFFTDTESGAPSHASDVVMIRDLRQTKPRSDPQWMEGHNMVGLWPAWNYILMSDLVGKYDWYINLQMDHFLMPNKARQTIADWLHMAEGAKVGETQVDKPVMLTWGNTFLFNKKMVHLMQSKWDILGNVADESQGEAIGCPSFYQESTGTTAWPACPQDKVYPFMATYLNADVQSIGSSSCGELVKYKGGEELPEACLEMSMGSFRPSQILAAIKELSQMELQGNWDDALKQCKASPFKEFHDQTLCARLYKGTKVPVLHNLYTADEFGLARSILDHDDPKKGF